MRSISRPDRIALILGVHSPAARGPRPEKSKITDNSEPWLRNSDSIAEGWYIACKVNERVETWTQTLTALFVRRLTQSHRVVVLGVLAVIAHGLSRSTYDGDIWLEPMASVEERCPRFDFRQ